MKPDLESQPLGFSACVSEQDRSIVNSMKTAKAIRKATRASSATKKTTKTKKMKTAKKMKATPRRALKMKKPVRAVAKLKRQASARANVTPISDRKISDRPKTDRLEGRVFTDAREYDRRVFVRFDAAGKEMVKTAAGEAGLSPYIAHFAAEAAKAGKTVVATPVSTRETGVFARFESPTVKKMVAKAARECGISLSAYAAYFAVEAAKAARKMPMPGTAKEKTAEAS
jgi:hypothetical protein